METVGDKIRIQRQLKNYSQEYMAFMLEISQPAYSKIERNETSISLRRLCEIADILEVSPGILIPPSKYGSGINYLKLRQAYARFSKRFTDRLLSRRLEADKLGRTP